MRKLTLLLSTIVGLVAMALAGPAYATPSTLAGELLFSLPPATLTNGECVPLGTSTFAFTVSGAVLAGPYTGTFVTSGTVTVGPQIIEFVPGQFRGPILAFSATFTITGPEGTVSGTKSLALAPDPNLNYGGCFGSGPGTGAGQFVVNELTYAATISTPSSGSGSDQGTGAVNFNGYFINPGANSSSYQFREWFFVSTEPPPTNNPPVITSTAPTTATEDTLYTYNATASDPDGPGQTWSLLGTNTCGGSIGAATGVYTFTPTGPVPPASCVVAIRVCDGGVPNLCHTQTTTVTITAANEPPAVDAGGPYSGSEGSAVFLDGTVSDPDAGDNVTTGWTYTAGVGVDAGATCSFADASAVDTTVTCTDDGTYTLTLTADDDVNPPVASTATLTVGNVNPVVSITVPVANSLYAVGATVPLTAPFTDAGKNDTHTCTVDWDDGAGPVAGTVTETVGSGGGTCSSSKTFTAADVYSIAVAVTDDNLGVGKASEMIIVYDPSAGFVTGGGWINSPAGAYAADLSLTGKANFGFVSKYKKGTTVPTGETEFQFQAGSFNFHSDAYQWLVVSGMCKAQFKGTGSVNGVAAYGFLLTAIDGDACLSKTADKFRIKVWKLSDNSVVYDNKMGASTDIDAADPQAIAGGQIVIHK